MTYTVLSGMLNSTIHTFMYSGLRRVRLLNSYLEILTATSVQCTVSFKQIQILNQMTVFFIELHVYKHSSDI